MAADRAAAPEPSKKNFKISVAIAVGCFLALLIPVGGCFAAIAIPNLLNAIDRGKQKRTMVDIRTLGQALESYSMETNSYPEAETMEELRSIIEPDYIASTPTVDGWGNELVVWSTPMGYSICSPGKDGGEICGTVGDGGTTTNFDDDIVFRDGQFIQWPVGLQQ